MAFYTYLLKSVVIILYVNLFLIKHLCIILRYIYEYTTFGDCGLVVFGEQAPNHMQLEVKLFF